MSSAVRQLAQVNAPTGFFYAAAATAEFVPVNGSVFNAIMTTTAFSAATTSSGAGVVGTVYRDLGKTVIVVSATTGLHLSKFRLVSPQENGASSEGYGDAPVYICTWTADSVTAFETGTYAVTVARTG